MIIPASDLSEQISTAGMEASGTGNMKLALNGALTIGTLDGANIEILDRVGQRQHLHLRPDRGAGGGAPATRARARRETIAASPVLQAVLEAIGSGVFSPDDPQRYRELVDVLTDHDHFLVTADFDAYVAAQRTGRGALAGHRARGGVPAC